MPPNANPLDAKPTEAKPAAAKPVEIGLYSFAERTPDPATGELISTEQRLVNLVATVERADALGLDVFALGEHHRPDYVSSTPAVILAAAAARTERIRLSSAVSVLSSDDPIRVFQDFATLDLVSHGRAEIMAGRGSFVESFPLFGYDLRDYDRLFAEKLDLLLAVRAAEHVHWSGWHRAPLEGQGVYPRPLQNPLPVWLAVGGTPASVTRAAKLGLPLALAIIGGEPARFAALKELYQRVWRDAGHDPAAMRFSLNVHGFIAEDRRTAIGTAAPAFMQVMNKIGRERGWPPMTRAQFEASCELEGANLVGGPDEVAEKLLYWREIFDYDRALVQLSVGTLPHDSVTRAVGLLATEVAPSVRGEDKG